MKHPTPSDFIVDVKESHVSVIFKPTDSHYNFGRLADAEDIARHKDLVLRRKRNEKARAMPSPHRAALSQQ